MLAGEDSYPAALFSLPEYRRESESVVRKGRDVYKLALMTDCEEAVLRKELTDLISGSN